LQRHRGSVADRHTTRLALAGGILAALAALPSAAGAAELARASGPSDDGGPQVYTATSSPRLFFDHRRKLSFHYRVVHREPVTTKVSLVKPRSGKVIERWTRLVEDDSEQLVRWNGMVRKELQGEHKYAFRVTATADSGATTLSARPKDTARDSFKFWHHRFPVRGKHTYGDGLGAGRGHQGQDVFAKCGARLQAARGGKVQTNAYHGDAGYYVVIDGKKTRKDFVYMHLKRRGRPADGDRVKTGQTIGKVGETGNASGCHLHFELWSGPGWYEGGEVLNPTRPLKRWDKYS
jgi:murein DD-endopeptidase MepM/ murein hydrolase activator NlpD